VTGIRWPIAFTDLGTGGEGARAAARADWRRSRGGAVLAALATLTLIAVLATVQDQSPLRPAGEGAIALPQSAAPTAKATSGGSAVPAATRRRVLDSYGKLPLSFVPNVGQSDRRVRYYAQGKGFSVSFMSDKVVLSFTKGGRGTELALVPLAANANARLDADRPARGTVNYFVGQKRHTSIPTYHEIAYRDLWPGIDMVLRGRGGRLKYEFRLAPGADPSRIRLAYQGAEGLSLGAAGNLLISTPLGILRDSRPRSYQRVDGERVAVKSRYVLDERASAYGFALGGSYDRRRPLVIDPGLAYSTYLGGTGNERGIEIAVDGNGNAYVTGGTYSADFPTSAGVPDQSYNGSSDAFVTKLNASGSDILYSTYVGGSAAESGLGIAVDASGNAYVTGGSGSANFPTTAGAFDTSHNGNEDVWILKLNATGSTLVYSTFLGGSSAAGDFGASIAVDRSGNAYVTGGTGAMGFPITAGSFDTSYNGDLLDAFVAKLNATGSGLVYSTFLGGGSHDVGTGIDVGAAGAAYVTGNSSSSNYPTTAGSFDPSYNGKLDAFVTKLGPAGAALNYSTFLGKAADDFGKGVAVDRNGRAYVAGWTASPQFPITLGAFDTSHNGGRDGFVSKLEVGGSSLAYSTFLGGSGADEALGIDIDSAGSAYVAGSTNSSNFPTTAGAFDETHNGDLDAFFTKLGPAGAALTYSTFLGGSGVDFARGIAVGAGGNAYLPGRTASSNFPTPAGAYDSSYSGGALDAFAAKVTPD